MAKASTSCSERLSKLRIDFQSRRGARTQLGILLYRAPRHPSSASTPKYKGFLDFVLSHYVEVGVDELDQEKLTPLLRLKYSNSISDAIADLGNPEDSANAFVGFQKYLYQSTT